MTLRLRYASIAVLFAVAAGCSPPARPMTMDQAIDAAKSQVHGDAFVQGARVGPLSELAPPGMDVDDPNRRVWVVTLRGVFRIDCKIDAAGNEACPVAPTTGLIVIDALDASVLTITRITVVPATEPPPTGPPGVVSRADVSSPAGPPLPA